MKIKGIILKHALQNAGIKQGEAAKRLKISRPTLSVWCNKDVLTPEILNTVKALLDIDLTSVRGEVSKESNQGILSTYEEGSVPIYDLEISAGTVSRLIDDNNNVPLAGWLYLKDTPNTTGLLGVKAKGDSMATFIDGGDIMLIRKLENFEFIPPGHAYVVISEELSIVKYIRNGKDDDHWTLRSHNDKYEDFSVKRTAIKHLFIVVKVLKELSY